MKFVAKINVWLTFSPPLFCWGLWIRESGSGMGKKSGFGFQDRWRIRNTVFFFHLLYLYHSENKFVVIPCFGIHKFHKIEYYLIFEMLKKIFAPIFKNYRTFNPKNVTCQHCGGSGMFIPDPGSWFLPIPDPDPQHCWLRSTYSSLLLILLLLIFQGGWQIGSWSQQDEWQVRCSARAVWRFQQSVYRRPPVWGWALLRRDTVSEQVT